MNRWYLRVVGVLYLALGLWCTILPDRTSQAVGFSLINDAGRSEFMTVYGGLELGLAWAFLNSSRTTHDPQPAILFCLIVHACIVAFRTLAFVRFTNVTGTTYGVAVLEWLILIGAVFALRACETQRDSESTEH